MSATEAGVRKTTKEVKQMRVETVPVSKARILRVLFESKEKLSIGKIIEGIIFRFEHEYPKEKVLKLCSGCDLPRLIGYDPEVEGYELTGAGRKLVACAVDSYKMDPIKFAEYAKFERKSTTPNVPVANAETTVDPSILQKRKFEAQHDCV